MFIEPSLKSYLRFALNAGEGARVPSDKGSALSEVGSLLNVAVPQLISSSNTKEHCAPPELMNSSSNMGYKHLAALRPGHNLWLL
jgi:hypothetical protein